MQMYSAVLRVLKSQVLQSNGQQYLQSGYLPVQYDRAITFHSGYRCQCVSRQLCIRSAPHGTGTLLGTEGSAALNLKLFRWAVSIVAKNGCCYT